MAVHGLFDFLFESCSSCMVMGGSTSGGNGGTGVSYRRGGGASAEGGRGGDVPLLLSREPFLNASLKALKVTFGEMETESALAADGYHDGDESVCNY